jgi:hypothetical protein
VHDAVDERAFRRIAALVLVAVAGRTRAAGVCLAAYSGSGLVGIGHYAAGGTGDFPWWRHAHIAADIALGLAILAIALWLVTRPASAAAGRQAVRTTGGPWGG